MIICITIGIKILWILKHVYKTLMSEEILANTLKIFSNGMKNNFHNITCWHSRLRLCLRLYHVCLYVSVAFALRLCYVYVSFTLMSAFAGILTITFAFTFAFSLRLHVCVYFYAYVCFAFTLCLRHIYVYVYADVCNSSDRWSSVLCKESQNFNFGLQ